MVTMTMLGALCGAGSVIIVVIVVIIGFICCRRHRLHRGSNSLCVDRSMYEAVGDYKPPSLLSVSSMSQQAQDIDTAGFPASCTSCDMLHFSKFIAKLRIQTSLSSQSSTSSLSSSSSSSPMLSVNDDDNNDVENKTCKNCRCETGKMNNNEVENKDLQFSRESRTVQPKSSMSTTSRSSMRSEQFTDDTSSISAKSDASVDSLMFDASFGAIRPDLYPRKDIVLQQSSLDSGHGRLHTRLKYDFRTCDLVVHLIEAQDIPASDPESGALNDPYIRISLEPCVDERVRQSSVKRRTCNPYFNEYFKFPLDFDDLKDKTLMFNLFDYDKFSRHSPLGDVEISMTHVDVSNSVEMWCDVQRQHRVVGECGQILISLSYLPTAERLTVVIMKAKDIKLSSAAPSADPFVRVGLMVEGKKVKKKKTSVRRASVSPVWNEALTFNVPAEVLPKVSLEVSVLDHDLLGQGEMLGRCYVCEAEKQAAGELSHWKEMMTNQRKAVARWHILRK